MESSITENDNDLLIPNLGGMPILMRIGAQDRTVHPWDGRRMLRLLRDFNASAEVELKEVQGSGEPSRIGPGHRLAITGTKELVATHPQPQPQSSLGGIRRGALSQLQRGSGIAREELFH